MKDYEEVECKNAIKMINVILIIFSVFLIYKIIDRNFYIGFAELTTYNTEIETTGEGWKIGGDSYPVNKQEVFGVFKKTYLNKEEQ